MNDTQEKRAERVRYSETRLTELERDFGNLTALEGLPNLTIFAAGSYARKEASVHSDIDLFFLTPASKSEVSEININSLRMFGQVIECVRTLNFPAFSNDGQYLHLLHTDEILKHLGGRTDDHDNFFTARMLLLLEGYCLYGKDHFASVTRKIVESYFQDYPNHQDNFHPRFLLNDICRFWKTLLLNYENKRRFKDGDHEGAEEFRKVKQKVRNFKLKYSRMTTCFATIAALASTERPIDAECVIELTKLTPYERLESVPKAIPRASDVVTAILDSYAWFLDQTGLSTEELHEKFSDEQKRTDMFGKAKEYGDRMFELLEIVNDERSELKLFRNLVI